MPASRSRSEGLGLLVALAFSPLAHASEPRPQTHLEARAMKRATRSSLEVTLPEVKLVRDDGQVVSLPDELDDGAPVVLTFIFTKCGTICPLMSQTFGRLQSALAGTRTKAHLVSISIDPEYDTPARLAEYGKKVGAERHWHFYTGTVEATQATQRAFATFRGDKMNHTPVTFLRAGLGSRWERIDGFASSDELAGELHQLLVVR